MRRLRLAGRVLVTWLAVRSCCEAPPFDPDGGWDVRRRR